MTKADLLYQLDLRLKEITQQYDKDFGGIAVYLLGDLLQLSPVKAVYIFERPKCADYKLAFELSSLWQSFKVINLRHNHRQGNDRVYADILNRLRIGKPNPVDIDLIERRVREAGHADIKDDAMFVSCVNRTVNDLNTKRINALPGPGIVLNAVNINSTNRSFQPWISKNGNVHTTAIVNELTLKPNARVMLIYNVNTVDSLTNGALGEVLGF